MTWRGLLEATATGNELDCVDAVVDDALPDDLLNITVTEPVGWPVVTTQLLGIEFGDDKWAHELWRCLSAESAAAAYLSVFSHEIQLLGYSIGPDDQDCFAQAASEPRFSEAALRILTTETGFPDGDLGGFMDELDGLAAELVIRCTSVVEQMLYQGVADELGGELTDDEIGCVVEAVLDEAHRLDIDLGLLCPEPPHSCGLRADGVVTCWGDTAAASVETPPFHGIFASRPTLGCPTQKQL